MKMTSGRRALDKVYKRRDRYEIPDWQRDEVWDDTKKQKLIDSVLRGWRLPKFYLLKVGDDGYEVVDGQQRLTAIWDFFDNTLLLSEASAAEFGGAKYQDLPARISDDFDDFEIDYDEIESASDEDLKNFFQRLQEGLPLTSSEKLNSVHSKLRDFCKKLSKHDFFKNKVALADNRFSHFDVVTKVVALEIEGISSGIRFDDISKVFKSNSNFSTDSAVGQRVTQTFDYLNRVFPEKNNYLKNRTVIQSLATFTARLIASGNSRNHERALGAFFDKFVSGITEQVELGKNANDENYIKFQRSVSANVKSGAKTRQEVLLRKVLQMDSSLASLFGPSIVAESGADSEIRNLASKVSALIHLCNESYSSKHGDDLFKATSKTVQAQLKLCEPIYNIEDYKVLINSMYFLFKEGVGQRLLNNTPQIFVDINAMRTDLNHDVDHGEKSRVGSKKRKHGATFEKFSGVTTPLILAPELFPTVQIQILSALETDLQQLLALISTPALDAN